MKTLFLAALLLGSIAASAATDDPAPDLAFTDLLQAPAEAKTDWASLRGKAIVLNFWATWCVPCVAEIPLMNSLAASVDPAKVQFIAADYNGEDRKKVEAFLKKHPISAWIGLDTSHETQKHFGVHAIPVTFVIGPDGRIAHVTGHPNSLTAEKLNALADGKPVAFDDAAETDAKIQDEQKQAATQAEKDKLASFMATNGKTLASNKAGTITLSEAARAPDDGLPADLARTMIWSPGRFDLLSARIADLAAHVFHTQATRVAVSGVSADKRYNLYVDMPGADAKALDRAVAKILSAGLGVTFRRQTIEKDVFILTANHPLDGSDDTPDHYCIFLPDKSIACESGSFDDLAVAVESALQTPVLDEKRLAGRITATLPATAEALSKNLGITLSPAKRPVGMVLVSAGS